MNKFTFQYWGIAFHWVVLTYNKNVEAHTKGKFKDSDRSSFCIQQLPFVETYTGEKCSWLNLGGENVVTES